MVQSFTRLMSGALMLGMLPIGALTASAATFIAPPSASEGCTMQIVETAIDGAITFFDANGSVLSTQHGMRLTDRVQVQAPVGMQINGVFYTGLGEHRGFFAAVKADNSVMNTYNFSWKQVGKNFNTYVSFANNNVTALRWNRSALELPAHRTVAYFCPMTQSDNDLVVTKLPTPYGDTVTRGANRVTMLTLKATAGSTPSNIQGLSILHEGFGSGDDLPSAYAIVSGTVVGLESSFDPITHKAHLTFPAPLVVAPHSALKIQIAADVAPDAQVSSEHILTLAQSSDVQASTPVSMSGPLRGNTFRIAAVQTGKLTLAYRSFPDQEANLNENSILGRLEIAADSTEDQTVYALTLKNIGSAWDSDIHDLTVTRTDGTVLTNTVQRMFNGKATFIFNPPFTILEGDNVTLDVRGTPVSGKGKTVSLAVQDTHDLFSVGSIYGYGVNGQLYGSTVMLPTNTPTVVTIGDAAQSAELFIMQRQTGSMDTAVANQKNVTLLRFEGNAGDVDVLLSGLTFKAKVGNLISANYALWVDTNDDGIVDALLQNGVYPSGDRLFFHTFSNGGFVIPANHMVAFEVHGDIAASLSSAELQLAFATDAFDYVQAERADNGLIIDNIETDGTCLQSSCAIHVVTNTAQLWKLFDAGNLFVTQSVIPVRSRQLLGGELADAALRLQFHAEYEDVNVTHLVVTAIGDGALHLSSNVQSLEFYKVGSVTPFAVGTVGGCAGFGSVPTHSMCVSLSSHEFIVPKGEDVDVLVRPRIKTDEEGSLSGDKLMLSIDATPTEWSGTGAVRAVGNVSSNTLHGNDGDASVEAGELFIGRATAGPNAPIVGPMHTVVLAKISSLTNANPDPNGSAISAGVQAVGQFKFSAFAHNNTKNGSNDWTLHGIIFDVNATNVLTGTGFSLFNKSNVSVMAACTPNTSTFTGHFTVTCENIDAIVNSALDQGEDATFVLQMTVLNPKVAPTNSTLQVSLTHFADPTLASFGVDQSHIEWIDHDAGTSQHFFWIDYPETVVNSTSYQA